ncbi:N-acetyllactosaminide 3-alpha-galactosyltransferase [Cooperia oncophora]
MWRLYMKQPFTDTIRITKQSVYFQFNYTLLFSVGMPNSLSDRTVIEEESALYDDILQFDFDDTYRNLTLKHLAELRYLHVCDENVVILKMDDDVGWDVQRVSEFVRNNLTSHELYCSRRAGHKPFRNPKSKWVVTKDEWKETVYPPHCLGWFYLVPVSVVRKMLSVIYLQRFSVGKLFVELTIDDIFITGVLRQAANVSITNMDTISGNVHYPKPPYGNAFSRQKKLCPPLVFAAKPMTTIVKIEHYQKDRFDLRFSHVEALC